MAKDYYSEEVYKNLDKRVIEAFVEPISKNFNFNEFKAVAQNFLNINKDRAKETTMINKIIKRLRKAQEKNPDDAVAIQMQLNEAYDKRLTYRRERYIAAAQFESKLSEFLYGNAFPRSGFYVVDSIDSEVGHMPSSIEMTFEEMAKSVTYEGRLALTQEQLNVFRMNRPAEIASTLEERQKSKEQIARAKMSQASYSGTMNRMDRYYELHKATIPTDETHSTKEKRKSVQKQGAILVWMDSGEQQHMKIPNSGVVKEAYIGMLLDIHKQIIKETGSAPYYSDILIGFFADNYLSAVDNLATILQDDIFDDDGNMYSIKSLKAALPLTQYIKSAEIVLKAFKDGEVTKERISKEISKKYYKQKGNLTTKNYLNEHTEKVIERVLVDTLGKEFSVNK